ncbi:MAG: DUF1799 domain-containing protein [Burkholderiales bacterium]|nr:DUF1799 domain-containing protein [Burkholderiales bacterium]MDP2398855.1 DUF1799 domain-containing protein [Burkholderiales bacterium]MDP3715436.1 DUF1799 domain-containing protein [Burkholderiales bacterium]
MPPALEWERQVWELYERLSNQWRTGFSGRTGLDYGPFISVMQVRSWDIDLGTQLLRAIEHEVLSRDPDEPGK